MKFIKYLFFGCILSIYGICNADLLEDRSNVLRVGTTGDYAPISFFDEQGKLQGFAIDMAKALGKHLNKDIKFVRTSWPTLSQDLKANKFDIAMGGITYTPARAKDFLLTSKVIDNGKVALVRCEYVENYLSEESINQASVRVVVNPGGTNEKFVKSRLLQSQVITASDNYVPFSMLLSNKADVMVTDLIEARYQSRLHMGKLCVANSTPFAGTSSYKVYMTPKTNHNLLNNVNEWLNETDIESIAKKWKIDP
ncbi:transporter substrate-binding domain-containing protein [Spartinivicinus poritis]|uniref:Transporter substrate-binding domain-containing protein n=1 Tax=Spartinivicinus poritis TaxID=2994640 RepID=A0ABT5UG41_9GAMM|nr:transporter substrate-binding domain-containing protein [Spartinivicinus sp. A2-2]MDE1464039.1 transporter substrate-binding domain-containing protein [Spartinivicinus sp. A2-2]